jgi:hypothetical protein
MMMFAVLLGARKKVPLWRIGRAKVWMRGHLWLGGLSLPMILFHSGFTARGPLTLVLITLLFVVVASGVTGALIQHYVPRMITSAAPLETIYEQIPHVRETLRAEASAIIDKLCAEPQAVAAAAGAAVAVAEEDEEETIELSDSERSNLRQVYMSGILPFLRNPDANHTSLANASRSAQYFEALRRQLPASTHPALHDLESICEEERQLTRQRKMYVWLHGWLLVHVPLSITLLVLGGIHALVAIRY